MIYKIFLCALLLTLKLHASSNVSADAAVVALISDDDTEKYNWTREFILRGGETTMLHTPDYVGVGDSMRVGGKLSFPVGSSINGQEITGVTLVVSPKMTYDTFVKALVASGIYKDEPGNWFEVFQLKGNNLLIHHPDFVCLRNGGQQVRYKVLTIHDEDKPDIEYPLFGNISYDAFVGTLKATGIYQPE